MKIFTTICLAITLAYVAMLPTVAFADSAEKEICTLALADSRIEKCSCLVYERSCIVAIKCNFEGKTQRNRFVQQLQDTIRQRWQIDNVFVVSSPKIMQAVDSISKLPPSKRQQLIEDLFEQYR